METTSPHIARRPRASIASLLPVASMLAAIACASVPPQVAKTHQRELEILQSLERAHLAMVDSYVDQKLQNFERFFFTEYGPTFLAHWLASFRQLNGRDYDPSRDFPTLYNDLVAQYQTESAPIEHIRVQLREAIAAEYRNAVAAHKAVGGWLDSLEKLNAAQRQAIDDLLGAIQPGLSLDAIDRAIETARRNVEAKITDLR